MKTNLNKNHLRTGILSLVSASLLVLVSETTTKAADGTWTNLDGGNWSAAVNWLNGIIADGAGSTANFNTLDLQATATVTLDSPRVIGNIIFGDTDINTANGWIISNGGVAANSLTLSNSAAKPLFTVNPIHGLDGILNTNDVVFKAVITGQQGWIKKGFGCLTPQIANAVNLAGSVQVDEGLINLQTPSALAQGRNLIYNGGAVAFSITAQPVTLTNVILTTGTIVSSNTYTATRCNFGAVPFIGNSASVLNVANNIEIVTGGTFPGGSNAFVNFNGTVDFGNSSSNWRQDPGNGGGAFGSKTMTVNLGTNTAFINSRAASAGAFHTHYLGALKGGPLTHIRGSQQAANALVIYQIGDANLDTTFDGQIRDGTQAGAATYVVKSGTGKLTLTGTNTYTGTTVINSGALVLSPTALVNTTTSIAVVATNAIFDVSAFSPAWTNAIVRPISGNGVITGSVAMVSGTLSPGNSIGKLTFTNDLFIDGTSLTTTNLFEIGTATNDQVVVAGNLGLSGTITVRLVPTGPFILNGTYRLFKWGGTLTGDTNNLVLEYPAQTGTLVLVTNLVTREIVLQASGVSTAANLVWRGNDSANVWDLAAQNWRNGANPSAFITGDNVTFDNSGTSSIPVDITTVVGPGSVVVNTASNYIFSSSTTLGKISSGASLFKTNSGRLTIVTDNDYAGTTTVAAGTLQIGNGSGFGTLGSGMLTNNGTVVFNRGADMTVSSVITGNGTLIQNGGDIVTLSAVNTYTNSLIISNGTVRANSTAALSTGTIVLAGGTLNPQGQVNNPINLIGDGTLSASLEIPINNTLSGTAGTLFLNNSAGNGFRFVQTTNFTFNRPMELQSGARTIAFYNIQSTQTYTGVISGPGGIHRRSPTAGSANDAIGGHVIFSGANTYAGGSTLSEGNIGLGSSSVVDVDGVTVLSGPLGTGTISYSPPAQTVAPFAWVALYAVGGPRTLANPITFVVLGTSDTTQEPLTLDGINDMTLSGAVTLNQTTFLCGLQVNNSNTVVSGAISGPGGILKLGSGTLTLSGDNSYSGGTIISSGKLLVNNTNITATGSGDMTVNVGATLGGNGAIAGNVTNNGTLAPGASIGTLTIGTDLTIGGNLAIEVNRSLAQSNDLVVVTGVLTNTGTGSVTVNNLGPALAVGNKFTLFSKPLQNGGALTVTGGGVTWANNLAADGSISVASTGAPTLNYTNTGTSLQFSWTGSFKLQAQTNTVNVGLGSNWADYPGGGGNSVSVPIDATKGAVFFRLISAP